MLFLFLFSRHRSRVPGRLHENSHRVQRFVRRSAVLVRIFVRSGLRVHKRHRTGLLRVLHTVEQVRYLGKELQTRGRQEEPGGKCSWRSAAVAALCVCGGGGGVIRSRYRAEMDLFLFRFVFST